MPRNIAVCFLTISVLLFFVQPSLASEVNTVLTASESRPTLKYGDLTISFPQKGKDSFSLLFSLQNSRKETDISAVFPLSVEIVDAQDKAVWLDGTYSSFERIDDGLKCIGDIVSSAKTQFHFEDCFSPASATGSIRFRRTVQIKNAAPQDVAFSTRLLLSFAPEEPSANIQYFIPGILYLNRNNIQNTALGSNAHDSFCLVREDRLPLPVAMLRSNATGLAVSISHAHPDGRTFFGEDGLKRIVDDRMQFGAMGFFKTSAAFVFPGSEGEMTYVFGPLNQSRTAPRSHPVRSGFQHQYDLNIRLKRTTDFGEAVKDSWRNCFQETPIKHFTISLDTVYTNCVELLGKYANEYNGVPGIPFAIRVPDGSIKDTSLQFGFVGQQAAAAAHLIRYGFDNNRREYALKGENIVNWWVKQSLTRDGLPRTWFDTDSKRWRDYGTYIRIASDGALGVLRAWAVMARQSQSKPEWLEFCRAYGNWLSAKQNVDGSFFRQYDFKGDPIQPTKFNTTHPVLFLVELHAASKDPKYLKTAIRAGEYSLRNVHSDFRYVGGTPDNPDVIDKEAGLIALDAFLALYDATAEKKWLDAAIQAATYSETWLYCWNVPLPEGDPKNLFPKGRSTVGMSIISTGHSGADTFMAYYPFQYYRLYLMTGDEHFLKVAKILLYHTKQLLDFDGALHYSHPGLQTEAMTISLARGHGIDLWLPWLAVAAIDPLVQFRDCFGSMRIDDIENTPLEKRRSKSEAYGRTRGFPEKLEFARSVNEVFLDDMKEVDSKVGHGTLGKRGSHGYGGADIVVKSMKAEHALSFHPPARGASFVKYNLNKLFHRFTAEVAISDAAPKRSGAPLTFKVVADGTPVWKSKEIREKGVTDRCDLPVGHVKELTLIVECPGLNDWAFGVWVNPKLVRK